jgi:hypothetical protein
MYYHTHERVKHKKLRNMLDLIAPTVSYETVFLVKFIILSLLKYRPSVSSQKALVTFRQRHSLHSRGYRKKKLRVSSTNYNKAHLDLFSYIDIVFTISFIANIITVSKNYHSFPSYGLA